MSWNLQQTAPLGKSHAFTCPIQPWNTLKNWQKTTLNGHTSKTRTNSESKLRFSESSLNFLQNNVIFCAFHLRGYSRVPNNRPPTPTHILISKTLTIHKTKSKQYLLCEIKTYQKVLNFVSPIRFYWYHCIAITCF